MRRRAPGTCIGRVYEYFLSRFASAEGKKGGEIAATQGSTTGYEAELWRMADTLRGSMNAEESTPRT